MREVVGWGGVERWIKWERKLVLQLALTLDTSWGEEIKSGAKNSDCQLPKNISPEG